jgi:hypothetical protein
LAFIVKNAQRAQGHAGAESALLKAQKYIVFDGNGGE